MSEKILQIALGLLAAALLSGVIMLVQKRKNRTSWSGTVAAIEKYTQRGEGYDDDYVSIRYIRDDGAMHSFECPAGSYPLWFGNLKPGDRLVKPAGESMPQRAVPAGH